MLFSRTKVRRFEYHPIYYQEEQDRERPHRIRFRRIRRISRKRASLWILIALFIFVLYLFRYFSKAVHQEKEEEPLRIESIEIVE